MDSLTLLVFLPLLGALLVALTPKSATGAQRAITLLTMLVTMVLGLQVCLDFNGASAAMQHLVDVPWFSLPGGSGVDIPVHFKLGLDGISVLEASAQHLRQSTADALVDAGFSRAPRGLRLR